jgi:hypothetical protein
MNHFAHILYLADGATGTTTGGSGGGATGAAAFWATPAGGVLSTLLAVVGVIVVLGAIFKIGQRVMKGEKGGILGPICIALVVGAICFNPMLINDAIGAMTDVVSAVITSFGNLFGGSSGGTTTTTTSVPTAIGALASHAGFIS